MSKSYHFIAIGGSVMHSLAIELKKSGHQVSGSDDQIYGHSRERLEQANLLPETAGWFPEKITPSIDTVIVGMHAKKDNPEIAKAKELGIKISSFPEFISELSKNKQRIVVGGSHGKTTISAMIVHVLSSLKIPTDFLIGAPIIGLENQIKISDAPVIVIEGDEYLASPFDPTPKFLKYNHHIGIISGIDWDHANVFPTEEEYIAQFKKFADSTPKAGTLIFPESDQLANAIGTEEREDVNAVPYKLPKYKIENGQTSIISDKKKYALQVFGEHNLLNIMATKAVTDKMGISDNSFFEAISSFRGAKTRLEVVKSDDNLTIIRDFAHSPSKVKASAKAVVDQFAGKKVIAVIELHTFSSLNADFVKRYKNSLKGIDSAIVFYQPGHKSIDNMVNNETIQEAFNHPNLAVFSDFEDFKNNLKSLNTNNSVLLFMSSGNFGGLDIENI